MNIFVSIEDVDFLKDLLLRNKPTEENKERISLLIKRLNVAKGFGLEELIKLGYLEEISLSDEDKFLLKLAKDEKEAFKYRYKK